MGIEQAGENSLGEPNVALVGGNDRQQPLDVAVVDDLIELFTCPGCGVLGPQVVEYEQGSTPNLVEAVVVGNSLSWVKGCAQVVEEIGYDGEVDAAIAVADLQCRCDRQMSFSHADAAPQIKPAVLRIRVTSKRTGNVEGFFRSWNRLEVLERMTRETVEIRESAQCLALPLSLLREPALAVDEAPKIGVSNRDLHAHPSRIFADWTAPGRGRRRRAVAAGGTYRDGEGGEDVANTFHRLFHYPVLTVALARFSTLGLPAFQDALDVAPGALVIGDRLCDRIFDPLHRPGLQRPHKMVGDEWC